ncbi:MAG: histidine kinase dimerization/phospho-acceptor domain-containing protein [Bdellovibrionota bacterium]
MKPTSPLTLISGAASPTDSAALAGAAQAMAVGHRPTSGLTPQDEELFRAFQSNLLSLISHELRTPLMGILNPLGMLEDGAATEELPSDELVKMARQNAQRLERALAALLDLATLESGAFHAQLREVDLTRLVQSRMAAQTVALADRKLQLKSEIPAEQVNALPLLADPKRFGRALDLAFQALVPRAVDASTVVLRLSSGRVEISFEIAPGLVKSWENAWSQALAGIESGVTSPMSAFGGVVQSEQAFLTRAEEGLGSELVLIHEIMRLHRGRFLQRKEDGRVVLVLELPHLASEEGLKAVLSSRAFRVSTELSTVALVLIHVPEGVDAGALLQDIRRTLFRSTDAVYSLPERSQLALVLDDCKEEDVPRLLNRIERALERTFRFGAAHCPADGLDPADLMEIAQKRVREAIS